MLKVTPFLWLDNNAEEAADLYVSTFENSKITDVGRYSGAGPGPEGRVMTVTLTIDGQEVVLLNGGPHYQLSPAFSFSVVVDTQKEIDKLWTALLADGGKESQCGWLTDRFGVSWQIVPRAFLELSRDPDPKKSRRVFEAMLKMIKFDIATLERAHAGN